jgi:DNA-binding response OmpR family regulator
MPNRHQKNKVIIVDDDEDLLKLLSTAFKAKGFEVHTIDNGKTALNYLLDEKNVKSSCLIILDRILPDMDGLDILKKFHAKGHSSVPVLVLSVLSAEKDILKGLKEGAYDYMAKPFNLAILLEKALSMLKR